MAQFLLELFSEEIPARMQGAAIAELAGRFEKHLANAQLPHGDIRRFVTPRRLAVLIDGLPDLQPDVTIEKKGPKLGAPQGAIDGFCKSAGIPQDRLEQREIKGETFYFASQTRQGQSTFEAMPAIVEACLLSFPWPKSMRWGSHEMSWVRPLRRILCLLDDRIVPVSCGHLASSNLTEGHRFLSPGAITIGHPSGYEAALEAAHVLADPFRRRARIAEDARLLSAQGGGTLRSDERLLDEVTGLVEWPVVLMGDFDPDYLTLPSEVLVLEMRHHQKYFAVEGEDGLANRFLTVANMPAADGGKAIIHGNRRVLHARLEDGRFYWNQDRQTPLAEWAAKLSGMLFHAKLGSMAEKARRIEHLAAIIAPLIGADAARVARAASLAKADLVTGMVGEFPELQGVMGRYYAIDQKEDSTVADAIRDHYKPAGQDDSAPTEKTAIAVALADKLDTLAGLFAAGEKPTGSKDPFALRRAALGILRIILENALRLDFPRLVEAALAGYPAELATDRAAVAGEILSFFLDRLKVMQKENGIRHDVLTAIAEQSSEPDMLRLITRTRALQDFLGSDDGANLLAAYRRASNIVGKEEKKDGARYDGAVAMDRLQQEEEASLHAALEAVRPQVTKALAEEDDAAAMRALSALRRPVDRFFDQVTVNADDAGLRENRLRLLSGIRALLDGIARFELIEG